MEFKLGEKKYEIDVKKYFTKRFIYPVSNHLSFYIMLRLIKTFFFTLLQVAAKNIIKFKMVPNSLGMRSQTSV